MGFKGSDCKNKCFLRIFLKGFMGEKSPETYLFILLVYGITSFKDLSFFTATLKSIKKVLIWLSASLKSLKTK